MNVNTRSVVNSTSVYVNTGVLLVHISTFIFPYRVEGMGSLLPLQAGLVAESSLSLSFGQEVFNFLGGL